MALDRGGTLDCVQKGRALVLACGDRVRVQAVAGGGAIEALEPRTSLFYRSDAFKEKLIAANVSQVIGVVAPDVAIDEHLLNRWIIGAEAESCRFVLVANKSDLPGFAALEQRLAPYERLGYAVVRLCAREHAEALLPWLAGQRSVLIGQSGMGKSTILNAVAAPSARARTETVSAALRAGKHTTSSTRLYPLTAGGWLIDSPGMSVFGLAHYPRDVLEHAFVELRGLVERCRFRDCRHDREPGCAVQAAVATGAIAPQRVELLHALAAESDAARDPAR
ncbi:MAG TPA: ribosome small subunit-dependent GTPase A [Casimicrobiaceae bacterium]|nr:ribosome small subunit-dependent GTPase A [Casimicrobiaceae bacterium]